MHCNFHIFKFRVYLISYTRLFTKLNLFEILLTLHLLQRKFPDLRGIYLPQDVNKCFIESLTMQLYMGF